eukprot:2009553-Pleurochrysis_carterae.AAC.1
MRRLKAAAPAQREAERHAGSDDVIARLRRQRRRLAAGAPPSHGAAGDTFRKAVPFGAESMDTASMGRELRAAIERAGRLTAAIATEAAGTPAAATALTSANSSPALRAVARERLRPWIVGAGSATNKYTTGDTMFYTYVLTHAYAEFTSSAYMIAIESNNCRRPIANFKCRLYIYSDIDVKTRQCTSKLHSSSIRKLARQRSAQNSRLSGDAP